MAAAACCCATVVLLLCYRCATVVLPLCYRCATTMLPLCCSSSLLLTPIVRPLQVFAPQAQLGAEEKDGGECYTSHTVTRTLDPVFAWSKSLHQQYIRPPGTKTKNLHREGAAHLSRDVEARWAMQEQKTKNGPGMPDKAGRHSK
jgi:hypothetical protein